MQQLEASAIREEAAAAQAATPESARIHRALAGMYRHEVAKISAVYQALELVFG